MKLTVACVQINLRIGQVEQNIAKVWNLLELIKNPIDIVLLPEFALTGYHHRSRKLIEPYLDDFEADAARVEQKKPPLGRLIATAQQISRKLECFTLMGYPERNHNVVYNSAVLVGPNGCLLHNYRKLFLYDADNEFGCSENPDRSFTAVDIVYDKSYYLNRDPAKDYRAIRTSIGICMDLNPYKFEAPFNRWEFASACYDQKSKLILCLMAWLLPELPLIVPNLSKAQKLAHAKLFDQRFFSHQKTALNYDDDTTELMLMTEDEVGHLQPFIPIVPSVSTINYWVLRFFPFLTFDQRRVPHYFNKVAMVACNRVGVEDDVVYTGTSLIMQFQPTDCELIVHDIRNPLVSLLGSLGQGEEGVLIRDVYID